jgi:acyl carrier protein
MPAEQIDPQSAFSDMGVDSILAGEAAQRLAREFGIEVKPTVLFNHPNLAALSAWIQGLMPLQPVALPVVVQAAAPDDALMSLLLRMERGEVDIELAEQEIRRIHD